MWGFTRHSSRLRFPGLLVLAACGSGGGAKVDDSAAWEGDTGDTGDTGETGGSEQVDWPRMTLSLETLDVGTTEFGAALSGVLELGNEGDIPLGIGSAEGSGIDLGPGMEGFSVDFDLADVECPDGGGVGEAPGTLFTLDPGCRLPIVASFDPVSLGESWGALLVESVDADDGSAYGDPIHFLQVAYLYGRVDALGPNLTLRPRAIDFGFVYPGTGPETAEIRVENAGQSPFALPPTALDAGCGPEFTLSGAPSSVTDIAGGDSLVMTVAFDPSSEDPTYCQIEVGPLDVEGGVQAVTIVGNSGVDATDGPPMVTIRSPAAGAVWSEGDDVVIEVFATDAEQPANSLGCEVETLNLGPVIPCILAASGDGSIRLAAGLLPAGTDTVIVRVSDGNGSDAAASVSVVIGERPADDTDGDGYGAEDCDAGLATTWPGAIEVFDGDDNDCDGMVDEETEGSDDDGDGVSEIDGDCDDDDTGSHPGSPESPDGEDNNCDGTVDDGTSLADDDGDGFSEAEGDCLDADPEIGPAELEICDGRDNNCNGRIDGDEGCMWTTTTPEVIGAIRASQNACLVGETVSLDVRIHDADGQALSYQWSDDSGVEGLHTPDGSVSDWLCAKPEDSTTVNVWVTATDPDGNSTYTFLRMAVYPESYPLYEPYAG